MYQVTQRKTKQNNDQDNTIRVLYAVASQLPERELIKELIEDGQLDPYGCDCTACQNGWDCCGNLFVSFNSTRKTANGFVIVQHYSRNI